MINTDKAHTLSPPNLPTEKTSKPKPKLVDEKIRTYTSRIFSFLKGLVLISLGAAIALTFLNGHNALTTATGILGLIILLHDSLSSSEKNEIQTIIVVESLILAPKEKPPRFLSTTTKIDVQQKTPNLTTPIHLNHPIIIEPVIIKTPTPTKSSTPRTKNLNLSLAFTPRIQRLSHFPHNIDLPLKQVLTPKKIDNGLSPGGLTPGATVNKLHEIYDKTQVSDLSLEEKQLRILKGFHELYQFLCGTNKTNKDNVTERKSANKLKDPKSIFKQKVLEVIEKTAALDLEIQNLDSTIPEATRFKHKAESMRKHLNKMELLESLRQTLPVVEEIKIPEALNMDSPSSQEKKIQKPEQDNYEKFKVSLANGSQAISHIIEDSVKFNGTIKTIEEKFNQCSELKNLIKNLYEIESKITENFSVIKKQLDELLDGFNEHDTKVLKTTKALKKILSAIHTKIESGDSFSLKIKKFFKNMIIKSLEEKITEDAEDLNKSVGKLIIKIPKETLKCKVVHGKAVKGVLNKDSGRFEEKKRDAEQGIDLLQEFYQLKVRDETFIDLKKPIEDLLEEAKTKNKKINIVLEMVNSLMSKAEQQIMVHLKQKKILETSAYYEKQINEHREQILTDFREIKNRSKELQNLQNNSELTE